MSKMKVGHDVEEGFSLRDALQEGYFSDLVVTSTDGQPFNVHRTILACCSPQMTCREWEVFLQTLKAQHLSAVLKLVTIKNVKEESSESIYDSRNFFWSVLFPAPFFSYIYCGSLPSGATVSLVRELVSAVSTNPKLTHLVNVCKAFIGSYDLKQRMCVSVCLCVIILDA